MLPASKTSNNTPVDTFQHASVREKLHLFRAFSLQANTIDKHKVKVYVAMIATKMSLHVGLEGPAWIWSPSVVIFFLKVFSLAATVAFSEGKKVIRMIPINIKAYMHMHRKINKR